MQLSLMISGYYYFKPVESPAVSFPTDLEVPGWIHGSACFFIPDQNYTVFVQIECLSHLPIYVLCCLRRRPLHSEYR